MEKNMKKIKKRKLKKIKMEELDYFLSLACIGVTDLIQVSRVGEYKIRRDKDCI
jgi:hypothetical protein